MTAPLRRRAHPPANRRFGQQDGFAAADALTALLILSGTLTLALSGLQQAVHMARRSEETV